MSRPGVIAALSVILLSVPSIAQAGMPVVLLNDIASLRLKAISFFIFAFALCAWGVQFLWNRLRRDFTGLPRLSYGRAAALLLLWGMLFTLVLSMISGARELMTPGAWEKTGITYRLATPADPMLAARRIARLEGLKQALWKWAAAHEGRLPTTEADRGGIPAEYWATLDPSRMPFRYRPGALLDGPVTLIAYEPEIFAPPRLGLFSDGTIAPLKPAELTAASGTAGGTP
jgi:hypothetical protein